MPGGGHPLQVTLDGRVHLVDDGHTRSLGRDPTCDIALEHELVSRHHGMLRLDADGWVFDDSGSTNGTFCNGERVTHVEIRSGVVLRLGDPETGALLVFEPVTSEVHVETAVPLDPGKRSTIYRTDRAVVRIGRDPDNEIVLDDLLVSRHHADLRGNETDGFEIVDASSHNG
ncbi:MAG TPA: FHA domain-containing protein, partial [Acidimicrobiia bacterium]